MEEKRLKLQTVKQEIEVIESQVPNIDELQLNFDSLSQ